MRSCCETSLKKRLTGPVNVTVASRSLLAQGGMKMSWDHIFNLGRQIVQDEINRRLVGQTNQPEDTPTALVQTLHPMQFQVDGRGFAEISQLTAGEPYIFNGNVFNVVKFHISITRVPPSSQINTYYSLLTDKGAQVRGTTLGKMDLSVAAGRTYVTEISTHKSEFDTAGIMRIWLDCSPSMDFRFPMRRLPPLRWRG